MVSSTEQKRAWQAYELCHAPRHSLLKFIYFEKAKNFCKISTVDLSYVVPVKSTVEISQGFVVFSGYMNFMSLLEVGHDDKLLSFCQGHHYLKVLKRFEGFE